MRGRIKGLVDGISYTSTRSGYTLLSSGAIAEPELTKKSGSFVLLRLTVQKHASRQAQGSTGSLALPMTCGLRTCLPTQSLLELRDAPSKRSIPSWCARPSGCAGGHEGASTLAARCFC